MRGEDGGPRSLENRWDITGMNEYERSCQEFDRSVLTAILKAVSPLPHKAADDILNRFPSFQHAARADHTALAEVIGNAGARLLRTIPDAVASMTRETAINAASYILTIEAAIVHFGALLNGRRNEALAVMYLNANNRLIGEDLWEGALDRAFIYPREITRRAILLDAFAVMMAHNHPSGDPTPSDADLRVTQALERSLDTVEVVLLDHVIYGEGEPYSLRANGDF